MRSRPAPRRRAPGRNRSIVERQVLRVRTNPLWVKGCLDGIRACLVGRPAVTVVALFEGPGVAVPREGGRRDARPVTLAD